MTSATLGAAFGDLWDALVEPGCPACRSRRVREVRVLGYVTRDYALDADVQRALTAVGALCARHLRVAVEVDRPAGRAPVGAALLMERMLTAWAAVLAGRRPIAVARCVVCAEGERDTRAELRELAAAVGAVDERVVSRLARSDPLCVDHVAILLTESRDPDGARAIVASARSRLAALRDRPDGLWRALSLLAGAPGERPR